VLRPNTTNAMIAIAMVIIPGNSRIVRGAVLSAKQNRYVEAAQAIGCRHPRIILSHILPNVTAPILVIASIWLGNAILIEATLSFLGVGTQPPTPSWGLMLSSTGRAFMEQAPWGGGGAPGRPSQAGARPLPRARHQPGRARLQPLRRYPARRMGSEAATELTGLTPA
jgi:ABC-type antimicrobial peptide transport system permease subunit